MYKCSRKDDNDKLISTLKDDDTVRWQRDITYFEIESNKFINVS